MAETAKRWNPVPDVEQPCADISFSRFSGRGAVVIVTMHFSRVRGGTPRDLTLRFSETLAVSWEEESLGLIETPEVLPMCSAEAFRRWTYPLLLVENSRWAEKYAARLYPADDARAEAVRHYLLVSMNDLLHILTMSKPEVAWESP
jgi:hypothetical protein